MRTILFICCAIALAAFGAQAASVDDVIEMTKKGEPEAKQIAAVDATPGNINVGAADVLRLRDAKVSEKVIVALLRHVSADTKTAAAGNTPAPVELAAPPIPAEKPVALPPGDGQPPAPVARNGMQSGMLTIDNLDDRAWSYMYEPAVQTIWIAPTGNGSFINAHSSTTVSMKVGAYKVRFSGAKDDGLPMSIFGGERSAISISRVMADGSETLNASIFEHGERKASGKLASLDKLPPDATAEVPLVEQPPVYYSDSPYYGPYYPGGYYYGRPYYGGAFIGGNFYFGGGGHGFGGGGFGGHGGGGHGGGGHH